MTATLPLLTVAEVAAELRLSEWTVRDYLRRGVLAGVRIGGAGPWRVRRDDVERLLESRARPLRARRPAPRPVSGRFARQVAGLNRAGARSARAS